MEKQVMLLAGYLLYKTLVGSAVVMALTAQKGQIQSDKVNLIVAPPHLIDKWKRELLCVMPKALIRHLKRHEERSNST